MVQITLNFLNGFGGIIRVKTMAKNAVYKLAALGISVMFFNCGAAAEDAGTTPDLAGQSQRPFTGPLIAFDQLHGKKITVKEKRDLTALVDGRVRSWTQSSVVSLRIKSDDTIRFKRETISYLPSGPTPDSREGVSRLSEMHPVGALGGGQHLFSFDAGELVEMRTFKSGAYRMVIGFKTDGRGDLQCTAEERVARENGGRVKFVSPRGKFIEILRWKGVGQSECKVSDASTEE